MTDLAGDVEMFWQTSLSMSLMLLHVTDNNVVLPVEIFLIKKKYSPFYVLYVHIVTLVTLFV